MYNMYNKVRISNNAKPYGTGWLPPLPDLRDYSENHPEIRALAKRLRIEPGVSVVLPNTADLREWCSAIDNQGLIGSCTAHAAVGVVEYFENKLFGNYIDAAKLFVYKTTRNLLGVTGDTGAWLRSAMGALVLCGTPAEKYWLYTDHTPEFDQEPPAFVYSVAKSYRAIKYFRHDPNSLNLAPAAVLESVKKYIAAGIPAMFGFLGFSSFEKSDVPGGIPFPCPNENAQWGHAIVAVGYDDSKEITNTLCNRTSVGALLIRNSWGSGWGEQGYGWLPYEYVLNNLAWDFWSLLSMEWCDAHQFGLE